MGGSTLTLPWWTLYILTLVGLLIIGIFNIIIPNDQRRKLKWILSERAKSSEDECNDKIEGEKITISSAVVIDEWYLFVAATIAMTVITVLFLKQGFGEVVMYFGGGAFGAIIALIVTVLEVGFVGVTLMVAPFVVEGIMLEKLREYYKNRYNVRLLGPRNSDYFHHD